MKGSRATLVASLALSVVGAAACGEVPTYVDSPAYCGLEALYAGARLLGAQVRPADLVKPEFLGRGDGSSAAELVAAAGRIGVRAKAMEGLTPAGLRVDRGPTLLFVKHSAVARQLDHWVLYLGQRGGMARVVDPAVGAEDLPLADLLRRWHGDAILLGDGASSRAVEVEWASWVEYASAAAIVLGGLYLGSVCTRRAAGSGATCRRLIEASAVLVVTGVSCAAGMALSSTSLHHQDAAADAVRRESLAGLLPKVSLADLPRILRTPGSRLVDARIPEDAADGMIPGAENIPADFDPRALRARVAGWDRRAPVVVYCLSPACPFSARVAARLQDAGFTDIRLFPGGWQEWAASRTASVGDGKVRGPATRRRAP